MEYADPYSDDELWCEEYQGSDPEQKATEDEPWNDEHTGADPEPATTENASWYQEDFEEGSELEEHEHGSPDCYWPSMSRATRYNKPRSNRYDDSDNDDLGSYYTPSAYHREPRKEYSSCTRAIPTFPSHASSSKSSACRTRNQGLPSWSPRATPINPSSRDRDKAKASIVVSRTKSREQTARKPAQSPGAPNFTDELISIRSELQHLGEMLGQAARSYTQGESSRHQHSALVTVPTPVPRVLHQPEQGDLTRNKPNTDLIENAAPTTQANRTLSLGRDFDRQVCPEEVINSGGIVEKPAEPPDRQVLTLGGPSSGHYADHGKLFTALDRGLTDTRPPRPEPTIVRESLPRTRTEPSTEVQGDSGRAIEVISGNHSVMGSSKLARPPEMAIDGSFHSVLSMTTSSSKLQLGVAYTVPSFSTLSAKAVTAQGHMAMYLSNFGADQTYVWHPGESQQATTVHEGIRATSAAGLTGEVLSFSLKALLFPFDPGKLNRGWPFDAADLGFPF
ncbi:PREDICTED: uncharacterized protein LOC104730781 isoform X1 [Camelina sativa]|uniref:Uncharacterized protein LOC104730781 isoform X1 n=1 Tax=Camelina sativa TaxID=90675 RepID=A0ABM1QSB6_CAMSA|nr:PREDICTED: uncharacterized protein LOC104730781 isoform X1 [Camelina sativa]XP_019089654.1 PREDICTED: uncharacterized protein LOC104730781 isoform X1 [Camelina sativa]XP_019089655.1 PREDICTED: uncharacterized protein LOC104730781 isoform X1 [Camelina sativa]